MFSVSYSAEAKLALYFNELAEGDRRVEVSKEVLSRQYLFEPYFVFSHLSHGKPYISNYDLMQFFKSNRLEIEEEELFHIMRSYSFKRKGELSYSEFLNLVLPAQNSTLRRLASSRKTIHVEQMKKLPIEVEVGLCKIFREEARLFGKLKPLKSDLASRTGYKVYQLFELVTSPKGRFITADNLRNFMRKHGFYALDVDVQSIIQRLDRDHDGKVSYMDFLDSLLPLWPKERYPSTELIDRRKRQAETYFLSPQPRAGKTYQSVISPLRFTNQRIRRPEDEYRPLQMGEPLQKSQEFGVQTEREEAEAAETVQAQPAGEDTARQIAQEEYKMDEEIIEHRMLPQQEVEGEFEEQKPESQEVEEEKEEAPMGEEEQPGEVVEAPTSPPKELIARELAEEEPEIYKTPERPAPTSPEYPTTGETPAKTIEPVKEPVDPKLLKSRQESLARIFKNQLSIDKSTEEARERVCIKLDYNIKDAFNFFDLQGRDSVSLFELRKGLERLGIYRNTEELLNVMKRYDLDQNGSLSYEEFENMVTPQKEHYSNLLEKRVPKDKPGEMVFMTETRILFKELMMLIVDNETIMEKIRRTASNYPGVSLSYLVDAFSASDWENKGYLTISEVKQIMNKSMNFITDTEAEIIMQRYDKDLDGRIAFSEFMREVVPSMANI